MYDYVLVNLQEDLEEKLDTLRQLQEDIPEEYEQFKKLEKIIGYLEKAVLEL